MLLKKTILGVGLLLFSNFPLQAQTYFEYAYGGGLHTSKLFKASRKVQWLSPINLGGCVEFHGTKRFYMSLGLNLLEKTNYNESARYTSYFEMYDGAFYEGMGERGYYMEKFEYRHRAIYFQTPLLIGWDFGRIRWQRNSFQISFGTSFDIPLYTSINEEIIETQGKVFRGGIGNDLFTFEKPKIKLTGMFEVGYKHDIDPARSLRFSYTICGVGPMMEASGPNASPWSSSFRKAEVIGDYHISTTQSIYFARVSTHSFKVSYSFVLTPWRPKRKRFPEKKYHIKEK